MPHIAGARAANSLGLRLPFKRGAYRRGYPQLTLPASRKNRVGGGYAWCPPRGVLAAGYL